MLEADPAAIAAKSAALFDLIRSFGDVLGLDCISPAVPLSRGIHISFRHPQAYPLCQALIADGVIGDFRDPDILRFGLTPLYLGYEDMVIAGEKLATILAGQRHLAPTFSKRYAVT